MEPHERVERSKKDIFINNFLGGLAWGLGVFIGISILTVVIGFAFSSFVIPKIQNAVMQIQQQFQLPSPNPNLLNQIQQQIPSKLPR